MNELRRIWTVIGLAAALAGCQGPTAPTGFTNAPLMLEWPSASGPAAEAAIRPVGLQEEGQLPDPKRLASGAELAEIVLGLPDAIEGGLTQNPDLIALRQAEGVSQAVLGVARTYPFNPFLQTRVLPYGHFRDGSAGSVYNYVFFVQTFELAHQRRRRTENAAAALEQTRWTIQQAELQNVALTVQLYFAALYQDGLRELAWITARLNDDLLAVAKKRFDAGNASAADVALVRLDAASTHRQAELADLAYENALRALRRQLNLADEARLRLDARLADFQWHAVSGDELCRLMGTPLFTAAGDRAQLVAELAAGRPDVLAARSGMEAANANLRLARAARVPNVIFGPYYQRDASATLNVGFQAEMQVPIVNTGLPLVRQRQAELQQQTVTFDQLEARARIETRTALERYEQARQLSDKDRASVPSLPEELQKLEEQFKKGDVDVLRVFQARTSLVQLQRAYLDSLNELAQAAAALTAASGLPPAALISR